MKPAGTARPNACVAWSTANDVHPPPTRTVRSLGSTRVIYQREVNYEAIITNPRAARAVPAAPNRNEHSMLTAEIDRSNHVRNVGTAHDQTWPTVDHAIIYLSCFIVALFARLDELASET
jgi:hypothetical protein